MIGKKKTTPESIKCRICDHISLGESMKGKKTTKVSTKRTLIGTKDECLIGEKKFCLRKTKEGLDTSLVLSSNDFEYSWIHQADTSKFIVINLST